jgi:hypothetical protein
MNKKILACKRGRAEDTSDLFSWARRNWCFVDPNKASKDKLFVLPYVIVTDGLDIYTLVGPTGAVDIGYCVIINKQGFLKNFMHTCVRFNSLIVGNIRKLFIKIFKDAKIKRDDNYLPLGSDDFEIIPTYHAVPGIDWMQVFPIYFLKLNANGTIILPDVGQNTGFTALTIGTIRGNEEILKLMPHVSKYVTSLISKGLISVPKSNSPLNYELVQ